MVALEEARQLLDALMGGDRNAALPKGAARPGGNKRKGADGMLLLPGKRRKSCYDPDICPLYTAWGKDVYELFVNTKSDLGPNPNVVDEGAHEEYMNLPREEKEKLGFDFFLFQKLLDLVRQCDRIISRNNEKLRQELARKGLQRADVPEQVDDGAVDFLCRLMVQVEDLEEQIKSKTTALKQIVQEEEEAKSQLEPLLLKLKEKQKENGDGNDTKEDGNGDSTKEQEGGDDKEATDSGDSADFPDEEIKELQMKLGKFVLDKGRLLYDISHLIAQLGPLHDDVVYNRRQLDYVKSDITTDKTVCEISGNFMSARDADERIAAHYAGKQFVGWKLVRDKLAEMHQEYGRYGPPPPARRHDGAPPPPMGAGGFRSRGDSRGDRGFGGGGGGRYGDRGSFRGPPGRFDDRGFRGGPPAGGRRW